MSRNSIISLLLLIVTLLFLVITACDKLVTEQINTTIEGYPKADFQVSSDTCCRPCTLYFYDDSDGPRDEYYWSFGDGDSAFIQNPSHVYTDTGNFNVTLLIRDLSNGNQDNKVKLNYIRILDTIPKTPSLSYIAIVPDTAALTYNFGDSTKVIIKSWLWDLGDNTTATTKTVKHTYDSAGTYPIRLTIQNSCDSTDLFDTLVVN